MSQPKVRVFFYALRKQAYHPPKSATNIKKSFALGKLYANRKDAYLYRGNKVIYGETMLVNKDEMKQVIREENSGGWKPGLVDTPDGPAIAFFYFKPLPKDAIRVREWEEYFIK